MQGAARDQNPVESIQKLRPERPPFMMPGLRPGVGKKNKHLGHTLRRQHVLDGVGCLDTDHPGIVKFHALDFLRHLANAHELALDPEIVPSRIARGTCGQESAFAAADIEDERARDVEKLVHGQRARPTRGNHHRRVRGVAVPNSPRCYRCCLVGHDSAGSAESFTAHSHIQACSDKRNRGFRPVFRRFLTLIWEEWQDAVAMSQSRREQLEQFLIDVVEERDRSLELSRGVRILRWFLHQLSHLYRGVVQLRLFLYRKGIMRHHMLGCQVISVGNLTVGGTGKTPVVEAFARQLTREGRSVAILSRGYKKNEPPVAQRLWDRLTLREKWIPPRVVSDGKELLLDSAMSGDEPYMLASNLRNVVVLVDKDRVKSGRHAINKMGCDTLILDDGFQYLALKHQIEILLVDKTNPFANENVLPRGLLREPVRNIKRANFVFITKSNGFGSRDLRDRIRELNPSAEIIECTHAARYLKNIYTDDREELDFLKGARVTVVSGIARPEGFEKEVHKRGAQILRTWRFADHHRYGQQEVINIINESKDLGANVIITTEKDAVRFPKIERLDVPIYFIRVDIEILSGVEDFTACIARICFRRPSELQTAAAV